VPTEVWGLVSTGKVSEFRAAVGNASQLWNVPLPTLSVIYRPRRGSGEWDYRIMTLEDVRREALGTRAWLAPATRATARLPASDATG
jgi:hypothetical protein